MRFLLLSLFIVCVNGQPGEPQGQLGALFVQLDTNHDHQLEPQELRVYYDSIDTNGDCKLNETEFEVGRARPGPTEAPAYLRASFTFYDTNFNTVPADGFLTCDDLTFFLEFLDTNEDDEVSLEEFREAVIKAEEIIAGIISGTVHIVGK